MPPDLMDDIRIWGMRILAAVLFVVGLLSVPAAFETHSSLSYLVWEPLDLRPVAAIALPFLFIGIGAVAVFASSRRLAESMRLRIGAALLLVFSLVLFALGYVLEFGS